MSKILALFESKAFDTGLLTTIAAAGVIFGFSVPVGTILAVLTPLMIGIGAQGWSDVAKMKTRMQHEHEMKMLLLTNPDAATRAEALFPKAVARIKSSQGGFVRTWVLCALAAVGAVL